MTTSNLQEQQVDPSADPSAEPNRFKYPEFNGPDGRGLLNNIIKQIVSKANHDTWNSCYGYQQVGNDLYVGAARLQRDLAIRTNLEERTIRWRWSDLVRKGLVTFEDKLVETLTEDGSIGYEVRHIKNFEGLYDLAHEFYQWWRSPMYKALQPLRQNAAVIRSKPDLAEWLLRFDCYRQVLLGEKRGRKPAAPQASYLEELAQDFREDVQHGIKQHDGQHDKNRQVFTNSFTNSFALNTNLYPKDLSQNGSYSKPPGEGTAPATTIRKPEMTEAGRGNEATQGTEKEKGISAAGGQNDYKDKVRAIVHNGQGRSPRVLIENIMRELSPLLNDASPLVSTATGVHNVFVLACVQEPEIIRKVIAQCAIFALSLPDEDIRIRHKNGQGNRVPMFIKSLAKRKDGLYAEMRKAKETQEAQAKEPPLDSPPPLDEEQSFEQPPLRPQQPAVSSEALSLLAAADRHEVSLTQQQRTAIAQGDPEITEELRDVLEAIVFEGQVGNYIQEKLVCARNEIRQLAPREHVILRATENACATCGHTIAYRINASLHCVQCHPHPGWSSATYQQIEQALATIPASYEEAAQELYAQLYEVLE